MSDDEMERLMDFILKQQAIFSSDMIKLKENSRRQSDNIDRLAPAVERLTEEAEVNRQEMRQAMENLIADNEATRELANRAAAELAINVS